MMAFNNKLAALWAFAVLLSWVPVSSQQVSAQEVPKRGVIASPGPAKAAVLSKSAVREPVSKTASIQTLELSLNKAKVITLPRPVGKIVIGNEAIADIHFETEDLTKIFIVSRAVGSTNVFFMDRKGRMIQQYEVIVTFDNAGIKAALVKLLPDENIEVNIYREKVFLTGTVHSADAAANAVNIASQFVAEDGDVTNMLTVSGGQQVIIKVRVAEMDRNVRKNLSVNTTFVKRLRPVPGLLGLTITGLSPGFTDASFASGTLETNTNVFGSPTFEALERQNLAKTLAEPTLMAMSGESASFLSGGEFPFPSGLDENGQTIFEFRDFGIRLEFTPVVLDNGRISLQISTEISAVVAAVDALTPASLSQKRTETTVEMPSGGTLMIAGLLKDDMSDTINGIPYLKDVPILGALFRSTAFTQQQTELVITVTAYLVKPIDNARSASSPTDGFEPASDIDIFLLGRLQRHYSDSEETFWDNPLKGPFGYIMK